MQSLVQEEPASDLYSGVDETNRSKVWVRVLHDAYALQPKVVDHFAELPRQLMRHQGPGLPRVLAVGSDASGVPYTVWEHLNGQTLDERLVQSDTAMTFEQAMEVMGPVLDALSKLHDLDKAHGELQPEAILLVDTERGVQPTLLHVGRPRDKARVSAYGAPELSRVEPSAESDVYSLGVLFLRLLSGHEPRRRNATSLRELAADLPDEVAALIESCLAEDPDARPPNALELLARAENVQKQLRGDAGAARRTAARPRPAPQSDTHSDPTATQDGAKAKKKKRKRKPKLVAQPEAVTPPRATPRRPAAPGSPATAEPAATISANARRDLVADALARIKKDGASDTPSDADKAATDGALTARKAAVSDALERAKKPAAAPSQADQDAAKLAAAREATVAEALAKAKKAPGAEPKPEPSDAAHNTHLYEHLWARKQKKKRSPLYTYGEAALFALFAWLLMRMTPNLTNPNLEEVQAVLGPEFKVVGVAMALSSVAVVGRLFALQAKVFGTLLKPVVMSMSGTAMCISVAVTAPFAGEGFLQPFQALARQGLAWFSGVSFAMGALFLVRWGRTQLESQGVAAAAGSFASAFMFVLSSGGMLMHGVSLPREVIDFSWGAEEELAIEEEELEEGEIGADGAKKVTLKVKGNLKDEASRLANRERAPGDPLDEASVENWEAQQEGTVQINQRTEMGGGGDDEASAAGVDQLRDVRKDNSATMKGIQKAAKAKLSFSE